MQEEYTIENIEKYIKENRALPEGLTEEAQNYFRNKMREYFTYQIEGMYFAPIDEFGFTVETGFGEVAFSDLCNNIEDYVDEYPSVSVSKKNYCTVFNCISEGKKFEIVILGTSDYETSKMHVDILEVDEFHQPEYIPIKPISIFLDKNYTDDVFNEAFRCSWDVSAYFRHWTHRVNMANFIEVDKTFQKSEFFNEGENDFETESDIEQYILKNKSLPNRFN